MQSKHHLKLNGEEFASKLTFTIVGRIQFLKGYWTEGLGFWWLLVVGHLQFLALRMSPMWQFASSMSARESASELEVTIFCNLITKMTAPPCCHILLVRSYSRGGDYTADGYEEMGSLGADFGLICCQPQPIQLIKSQQLIQGWVSNQSPSELGLRYLLEPSGKWHCWSSCVGRRR